MHGRTGISGGIVRIIADCFVYSRRHGKNAYRIGKKIPVEAIILINR